MPSVDAFRRAFNLERGRTYPMIDDFEAEYGYAIDRQKLEDAARVLACPVKTNPPNWQHGRVIYAVARKYLTTQMNMVSVLDIGTAKGFSALCFRWAIDHSGVFGRITSVDVLEPDARVKRNTVAEVDGFKTLHEIVAPWVKSGAIHFRKQTGVQALSESYDRIHLAFIDGKHTFEAVLEETRILAARQQPGDIAIFDDTQIDGVERAVQASGQFYDFRYLQPLPQRRYAIGTRRG